ncbi:MAG: DHHA1 domain-containing protein [Planctomycetota bacterium]|nr:DHHA1 domain-containing protein [Planctomycetota bacterium]
MVTVDGGVRAVDAVRTAVDNGMEVIVTDHHEPSAQMPPAVAIVDPMREDCEYPYKRLAGVGVAYKLVWALARELSGSVRLPDRFRDFLLDYLPIVALGTICDVVPLLGENRVFVKYGLSRMCSTGNPGLRSLLDTSGILMRVMRNRREVSARDIAYTVGPRINAAGRLGRADDALRLFATRDLGVAAEISRSLNDMNKERQEVEADILEKATEMVEAMKELPPVIMLADEEWHTGVLGIVASRLVNKYYRPTFLGKVEKGVVRGSARSIKGFDVVQCLSDAQEHLVRFGGHAGAAGFTFEQDSFDKIRLTLNAHAEKQYRALPRLLSPTVDVEAEVPFREITYELIRQLDSLKPFGHEHERPVFCATNVQVAGEPRLVGARNQHVLMMLVQDGISFKGIAFGQADHVDDLSSKVNILFYPQLETYNGNDGIQLQVLSFKRV